jgi:hypothetical protein
MTMMNDNTSSNHLFQFYRGRSRVRLLGPDVRPVQGSGVGRHHLHRPQETTTHLFALVTSMAYNNIKLLIAVL